MEHPPKQGLKHFRFYWERMIAGRFNGTSTKTRIETIVKAPSIEKVETVLMEHPPKQGLKPVAGVD